MPSWKECQMNFKKLKESRNVEFKSSYGKEVLVKPSETDLKK